GSRLALLNPKGPDVTLTRVVLFSSPFQGEEFAQFIQVSVVSGRGVSSRPNGGPDLLSKPLSRRASSCPCLRLEQPFWGELVMSRVLHRTKPDVPIIIEWLDNGHKVAVHREAEKSVTKMPEVVADVHSVPQYAHAFRKPISYE